MERSHSGLVRRPGKAVYRKVSRVQIPLSPQFVNSPKHGLFLRGRLNFGTATVNINIIIIFMNTAEQFEKIKQDAELFYEGIDSMYCPYLRTKVNFNAKGLDHIKMKSWNKTRLISDQYLRLKFLKLVPEILQASGTLQEIHESKNFERVKNIGKWQNIMKNVTYYGFVAIVNKVKIKIIVKKIGNGQSYFWSVIPFWKTQKDPICQQTKKVFHEGDLEND